MLPAGASRQHYTTSWYKAPTMLPAGDLVTSRQHYTTTCKHSLVLLPMREIIDRNMLS